VIGRALLWALRLPYRWVAYGLDDRTDYWS
jgi:hypothetical protein